MKNHLPTFENQPTILEYFDSTFPDRKEKLEAKSYTAEKMLSDYPLLADFKNGKLV